MQREFSEREVFFLTPGYTGRVTIIHDQLQGESKTYLADSSRVYHVPRCGILTTQFPEQFGMLRLDQEEMFRFYYVKNGVVTDTINYIDNPALVADSSLLNSVFAFGRMNGGTSSDIYNYKYEYVVEFTVDTLKNYRKYSKFVGFTVDMSKCK